MARRLALDVLYEADIRALSPTVALEARGDGDWVAAADDADAPDEIAAPDAVAYARRLVAGVEEHLAQADALIARYAEDWAIERMPVVDRNVLRIALYELLWSDGVPVAVAINEAVELVKSLSTDDSGRFVNGVLGRIAERELG